jgi:hypothetical protein
MRQDGERNGFLGVGVDSVIGGDGDIDSWQEAGEVRHDLGIVHSAATGDQVG